MKYQIPSTKIGEVLSVLDEMRLAGIVAGNANDAEDIVQESLTRVLRSLRTFDDARPFRPWFAAIVANQARNAKRSTWRRSRLTQRISAHVAASSDTAVSIVEEHALALDAREALLAALVTLEPHDREVLALRFISDLTENETATVLGVPLGTVKSRTSRALSRLRAVIGESHMLSERMES